MQNLNKVAGWWLLPREEESSLLNIQIQQAGGVSLVDVVSECVPRPSIVIVSRIVDILSVGLVVGVAGHRVVGVVREEQAVPCAMLLVLLVFLVAVVLIVSLEHGSLGDVQLILGDHGGEGLEVGAGEPGVLHHIRVNGGACEEVATSEAQAEEV